MSELRVAVPDELVETIARRAAELVREDLAPPHWLTLEEAAEHWRTTAGALRWRAQHGRLPGAVKDGGRWLVDARELDGELLGSLRGPRREGRAPVERPRPVARGGRAPHA
jgi:hypothetical protein